MVTLAVAAILLGLAVPSFNNLVLNSRLTAYANSVVASTLLARGEAIKRNAVVTMCVSSDNATCGSGGWEQGWIVLFDDTVIHNQPAAASGFKLSGSVESIDFQPTGMGATQATLTICRDDPAGPQERVVSVSASGRASVSKTSTGVCS